MKRIVFVCTGNTCRSPMAEALFRDFLDKKGAEPAEVRSAGIAAFAGMPPSEKSVAVMDEFGIDIRSHRSSVLTEELLGYDLIVTMTGEQAGMLKEICDNVISMPKEIPDPYGGDIKEYQRCRDAIADCLPEVYERLMAK